VVRFIRNRGDERTGGRRREGERGEEERYRDIEKRI